MIQRKNVRFYKKLICYFSLILNLSSTAFAFGNYAHFAITQSAYLRTKILDRFDTKEKIDLEVALINGCNIPDEEESDYIYKSHFYNIMPNLLNKVEDILTTKDNAEKRMYMHYQNGIQFYKIGNKVKAFDELGKSLHYMEDMCCPVHLLGWSSLSHNRVCIHKFKRVHDLYEEEMNRECGKFLYRLMNNDKPFDFRQVYSLKGIVGSYPLKIYSDYKKSQQTNPTYQVFKNAHQASCELIYLFFREVGICL